jgi:hypothetical protein
VARAREARIRLAPARAAALAVAVVAVAGGCAAVPTSGAPRAVTGAAGQAQQFVQPIPPQPQPAWQPQEVVQGFLAASASFADNHAAARAFLAPSAQQSFRPSWAVTVVSGPEHLITDSIGPRNQGENAALAQVTISGQQVASISDIGQYFVSPGSRKYTFRLARNNGQWLISSLPPSAPLLLSQAEFDEVYQPRNLYFWSLDGTSLVPEPVFAPDQDTYADVATNLVKALLRRSGSGSADQTDWLAAATMTSFPAGTRLIGVGISGSVATVNLGGTAARAGSSLLSRIDDQLIATLTSTSYGQAPVVKSVALEIDGRPRSVRPRPQLFIQQVPGSQSGSAPLYYLTSGGGISAWNGQAGPQVRGRDPAPFTQIAVHGLPQQPAAAAAGTQTDEIAGSVTSGQGCGIWYGTLSATASLSYRALPDADSGPCTSVSWDSLDDIWAVTAGGVFVLPPGGRQPVAVALPQLPGGDTGPYRVLAVQVAPDGVRVAMLVQPLGPGRSQGPAQVVMAAVTRDDGVLELGPTVALAPGLPDPSALAWFDPDHLVVLAQSELYDVPVNGGAQVPLVAALPGTDAVTSAGPGQIAVSGGGHILTSTGPGQVLEPAVNGTSPVYPQ